MESVETDKQTNKQCVLPSLDSPLVGPGSENWHHNSARSAYTAGMANLGYVYGPYHYGQENAVPAFWLRYQMMDQMIKFVTGQFKEESIICWMEVK